MRHFDQWSSAIFLLTTINFTTVELLWYLEERLWRAVFLVHIFLNFIFIRVSLSYVTYVLSPLSALEMARFHYEWKYN